MSSFSPKFSFKLLLILLINLSIVKGSLDHDNFVKVLVKRQDTVGGGNGGGGGGGSTNYPSTPIVVTPPPVDNTPTAIPTTPNTPATPSTPNTPNSPVTTPPTVTPPTSNPPVNNNPGSGGNPTSPNSNPPVTSNPQSPTSPPATGVISNPVIPGVTSPSSLTSNSVPTAQTGVSKTSAPPASSSTTLVVAVTTLLITLENGSVSSSAVSSTSTAVITAAAGSSGNSSTSSSSSGKTWAIVGGVLGGIILLASLVFITYRLTNKRFNSLDELNLDELKWPELKADNPAASGLNPSATRRTGGSGFAMGEEGGESGDEGDGSDGLVGEGGRSVEGATSGSVASGRSMSANPLMAIGSSGGGGGAEHYEPFLPPSQQPYTPNSYPYTPTPYRSTSPNAYLSAPTSPQHSNELDYSPYSQQNLYSNPVGAEIYQTSHNNVYPTFQPQQHQQSNYQEDLFAQVPPPPPHHQIHQPQDRVDYQHGDRRVSGYGYE